MPKQSGKHIWPNQWQNHRKVHEGMRRVTIFGTPS